MNRALLSDDELHQFHDDGYVRLGRILDDDQRAALLAAERRHRPDTGFAVGAGAIGLLVREQLCAESEAVRTFCIGGAHVPLLAQVLGPDVAFTHTQFITKLPEAPTGPEHVDLASSPSRGAGGTEGVDQRAASWIPMHQDDGYGELDPPLDVTVWTALTATDERNGCLTVAPGSHRGGLLDHAPLAANPFLRQARGAPTAVALPLDAGEAVLFSGLLLHGSGPNRSAEPRVGMHARYCHPGVRMVTHRNKPVLTDRHSWMVLGEAGTPGGR